MQLNLTSCLPSKGSCRVSFKHMQILSYSVTLTTPPLAFCLRKADIPQDNLVIRRSHPYMMTPWEHRRPTCFRKAYSASRPPPARNRNKSEMTQVNISIPACLHKAKRRRKMMSTSCPIWHGTPSLENMSSEWWSDLADIASSISWHLQLMAQRLLEPTM